MPRPDWTLKTTSRKPAFAEAGWQLLPAYQRKTKSRYEGDPGSCLAIWTGSGFQIRELPFYQSGDDFYYLSEIRICGNCKGTNTVCIYLNNYFDQSGADMDLEIYCHDCAYYTVYNGFARNFCPVHEDGL
jgi:hypothetical protein